MDSRKTDCIWVRACRPARLERGRVTRTLQPSEKGDVLSGLRRGKGRPGRQRRGRSGNLGEI